MAVRWSKVAPQLALSPAVLITAIAFFGAISWTVYLSFTKTRQFPDYTLVGWKQYYRLAHDAAWLVSLKNMVVLGIGSCASIVLGFILAALIDKEVRGEGIFRTIFLYPLAVSLIVTGLVWQWLFNPSLGIENFLHELGWTSARFNWLASQDTVMFGIILASVWQSTGFFMALMLAGLKSINVEIWQAAKLDIIRATLDAFAEAAQGGPAFPISADDMVHGAAVTEAIIRSAQSHAIVQVP